MLEKKTEFITIECPPQNWDNYVTHQIQHNRWFPVAALRTEEYLYVTFKYDVFS